VSGFSRTGTRTVRTHGCVSDRKQCGTRSIDAQRSRSDPDACEAVFLEQRELECIPATFWTNREEHTLGLVGGDGIGQRHRRAGIRHETQSRWKQRIKGVFHENLELLVYRDAGQSRIARLLQAFD
jgi:hypothetical protein